MAEIKTAVLNKDYDGELKMIDVPSALCSLKIKILRNYPLSTVSVYIMLLRRISYIMYEIV